MSTTADETRESPLAKRRALLDDWVALDVGVSRAQARQAALLAERMDMLASDPDFGLQGGEVSLRSLAAEYGAAAHIPPSTAAVRLTDAWVLVHHFPATFGSFEAGRISRRHVDVILTEAPEPAEDQNEDELRAEYESRVVAFAEQDTAARTRAHARGVATALSPDQVVAAHRRGRARRRVTVTPDGDGMALLIALLPEIEAYAIKDRLDAQAKQVAKAAREAGIARKDADREADQEADAAQAKASRAQAPASGPDASSAPTTESASASATIATATTVATPASDPIPTSESDLRSGSASTPAAPASTPAAPASSPSGSQMSVPSVSCSGSAVGTSMEEEELAAARAGCTDADPSDVVDIGDVGALSRTADAYEQHVPDTEPAPWDPGSTATVPPDAVWDDEADITAVDAEFDALVARLREGLPDDPFPPPPDRLFTADRRLPIDPIGVRERDERTMDQIRADIFADMLLTSDPSTSTQTGLESIRATVQVTISAQTLLGHDDRPAELDGVGPIDPEWARQLAGYAPSLDRLFLDHAGMVTATDSYTPTRSMKRFLRARDQHCRTMGCRRPAHLCEHDHNLDHAKGGPTDVTNLALFCTGHHTIKHPDLDDDTRWTARQLPGGVIEWTSPLGRTYTDRPPARVMFI